MEHKKSYLAQKIILSMDFDFFSSTQIVFGWGRIQELGNHVKPFGNRAFVVTGKTPGRVSFLMELLDKSHIDYESFSVGGEPTVEIVEKALHKAKVFKPLFVIALGGGSVLDTAKTVAALLTNPGEVTDYLEVVGKGMPLKNPSLPFVAIPTTSGTGTELTRNAVLGVPSKGIKVSMRSPFMLPAIALVDPQLTVSVSPSVTASTGMDALTQVMEAYVSNKSNAMMDVLCREAMAKASRSLEVVFANGGDCNARTDMSFVALMSGMALANGGLGAVHGFAGPLGGMIPASHGAICASLLPWVMEQNIKILETQYVGSPFLGRYHEVARILTGDSSVCAMDGVEWVKDLCRNLDIANLSELGFSMDMAQELIQKAAKTSSMKGNPIVLTEEQMLSILIKALGN